MDSTTRKKAWAWIPSLYFAQGVPYVVVMLISVIMYKRLGVSNTDIALYTSWLYLPWVIKPLWSPFIDLIRTKRWWIISMQLVIGAGLGGVALMIPAPSYFTYTLAFLWLLAFSSATHDIAADGFYMLALNENDQAWFVGIRSTFYRIAMITGQGLLIIFAGYIEASTGLPTVHVDLQSSTTKGYVLPVHPDSVHFAQIEEQVIQLFTANNEISIQGMPTKKADSLLAFAKQWNIENGFVFDESQFHKTHSAQNEVSEPGLWSTYIVNPLENTLRTHFGTEPKEVNKDKSGAVQFVYFKLAKELVDNEKLILNLGRSTGDVSIQLVEGARFEFNSTNWNKVAISVVQLDPKLEKVSLASFVGTSGDIPFAWSITFFILSGLFVAFFVYHRFALPKPVADVSLAGESNNIIADFAKTFAEFFKKDKIGLTLAFLLLYRLGEAQLVKLASPFLLDAKELGGLALTTGEVGFVYGTVGIIALTLGGITGGILSAKHGLKFWLWPMIIAMNVPNAVYIYLSSAMPDSLLIVNICVAIEQFGYGFGFTAYLLFMIYAAQGEHKTAHYAICTGFMALGMMLPGMISGWIQSIIGYENFFIWVLIATIPAFAIAKFLPIDEDFGKKKSVE